MINLFNDAPKWAIVATFVLTLVVAVFAVISLFPSVAMKVTL